MNDERKTPKWLFEALDAEFHFTLDAAATAENTLVQQLYFTKEQNALTLNWGSEIVWCNPPYSRGQLFQWVWKAYEQPVATTVMLLPGDCSTKAGQFTLRCATAVLFLAQRLKFDNEKNGAKFASWIALFGGTRQDKDKLIRLCLGVVL
ncbi:MAG: adenine methyltransferase [Patescibacteria group bacterium]|nr:adenine methyltransferase [Patescibacteria group bacterium]